jgi:prepilin signal peptidase PulO-like enzyme (type II secretory pathway)
VITFLIVAAWGSALWAIANRAAARRRLVLGTSSQACATMTIVAASFLATVPHVKLSACIGLAVIGISAVVDAQSGYIFDPLVVAGLIGVASFAMTEGTGVASLYGLMVSGGSVLCIWVASLGRGLGLGDVKLAAVVGAAFGPLGGITAIGLAFVVGSAVAISGIIAGKAHFGMSVRFGPYLLAGSVCLLAYHRLSDGVIR